MVQAQMTLLIRPSKIYLFERLKKKLANLSGAVGLDAGSADFKNRRMFQTEYYYGLDMNLEYLKQGLAKYQNGRTFGIHGDIAKPDMLPGNSVQVVVCTNTIHQLALPDRRLAISHLCRFTAPTGHLFCELRLDEGFKELLQIVKSDFQNVRITYYCNPMSRFYEWIFARERFIYPLAKTKAMRFAAFLVSRFEYLTSDWRAGNRHALIIATEKIASDGAQKFDLSKVPFRDRIYHLAPFNF